MKKLFLNFYFNWHGKSSILAIKLIAYLFTYNSIVQ